ncbi:MAG: NosD domain-containing protein, partial [bacterium]|nr:NosD domain-containing protein [bacterium]
AASDSNPGTFELPFLTIQRAANAMMPGPPQCTSATTYIFPGTYADRVTILSNINTDYMVFTKLSNNKPVLYGSLASNFAVKITNAGKVILSGLIIRQYLNGIMIKGDAAENIITGNTIFSNDNNAIIIDSDTADNNQIMSNNIWGLNQNNGLRINDGDNNTIRSNYIHHNQSDGIYFLGSASANRIILNTIFSNTRGIYFSSDDADNNFILTNNIIGGRQAAGVGIYISAGDDNIMRENRIHNYTVSGTGISLENSASFNYMVRNSIYSNSSGGITISYFSGAPEYNFILSNEFWSSGQSYGIQAFGAKNNEIHRNLFRNSGNTAISISASTNIRIFNNTIFKAGNDGLYANNTIATLYNNIILSNGDAGGDYGIEQGGTGSVYLDHNDFYGNFSGPTNNGCIWGAKNILGDPLLDTITSFTITSALSAAVDRGTTNTPVSGTYSGLGPDIGWKESPFTASQPVHNLTKGQDYISIADAIADATNNTHIQVDTGVYNESINLSRFTNLILDSTAWVSSGDSTNTVLAGNGSAPVVSMFNAFGCRLIGFTVKYGTFGVFSSANSPNSNYIAHNNFRSNIVGVGITNGDYNTITSNNIYKCSNGIYVAGISLSNTISGNNIFSNHISGIFLDGEGVDYNSVLNNHIYGNIRKFGVFILEGDFNTVYSNNIHGNNNDGGNEGGILMQGPALNNVIRKNRIYDNGNGVSLSGVGDKAKYNTIESNIVSGPQQVYGVYLWNADGNTIRNNNGLSLNSIGIYISSFVQSNRIEGNHIYSNITYGIQFDSDTAEYNIVWNNLIYGPNQPTGVLINMAGHNIVSRNQFYMNPSYGITIANHANSNLIRTNTFGSGENTGINITEAHASQLDHNLFRNQNDYGIMINVSTNNMIVNNTVYACSNAGIYLANFSTATLYNNIILSNGLGNNESGLHSASGSLVFAANNDFFGNLVRATNRESGGDIVWGSGNIFTDPRLDTVTSCTIFSASSPAVDAG